MENSTTETPNSVAGAPTGYAQAETSPRTQLLFESLAALFCDQLQADVGAPIREWIAGWIERCTDLRYYARDREPEEIAELVERFKALEFGVVPPASVIEERLAACGVTPRAFRGAGLVRLLDCAGRLVVPLREAGGVRLFWVLEDPGRLPESQYPDRFQDPDEDGIGVAHGARTPLLEPWETRGCELIPPPKKDWIHGLVEHEGATVYLVQGVIGAMAARAVRGPGRPVLCMPGSKLTRRHAKALKDRGVKTVNLAATAWERHVSIRDAVMALDAEGLVVSVFDWENIEAAGGSLALLAEEARERGLDLEKWDLYAHGIDETLSSLILKKHVASEPHHDYDWCQAESRIRDAETLLSVMAKEPLSIGVTPRFWDPFLELMESKRKQVGNWLQLTKNARDKVRKLAGVKASAPVDVQSQLSTVAGKLRALAGELKGIQDEIGTPPRDAAPP